MKRKIARTHGPNQTKPSTSRFQFTFRIKLCTWDVNILLYSLHTYDNEHSIDFREYFSICALKSSMLEPDYCSSLFASINFNLDEKKKRRDFISFFHLIFPR